MHIYPINDLKEHNIFSTNCECNPKIEIHNGVMLVIHNAFDQREIIEEVIEILEKDNKNEKV